MFDATRQRFETVAEMACMGLSRAEIGAVLGVCPATVHNDMRRAKNAGHVVPGVWGTAAGKKTHRLRLETRLSPLATGKLRIEASRRGVTLEDIARRILEAVAADGLVGAVLDDEVQE